MTIALTQSEFENLMVEAYEQGEPIYEPTELGYQLQIPQQIGQGDDCVLCLRGGLIVSVRNFQLQQTVELTQYHGDTFPIIAKFYISGGSRVKTPSVPGIAPDYEELAGHSYLYHLPDLTEIEEWQATQPIQLVMLSADVNYFQGLGMTDDALPAPLEHMLQDTKRFHQPLGKITPAMTQVLQQMLHCPYQGSAQKLYLESKALELFSLQLAILEADSTTPQPNPQKSIDLERIRYAQEILEKQLCNPPSLSALARQVGLNDCTLKRGFRQLLGTTVFGYLRACRMQQAQKQLRSPHVTVAQVAAQVGYRNPEAFSTAFRRQFAISPKAYQLRHRR